MILARTALGPRLDVSRMSARSAMDWSEQLSILLGVCEEFQSSAIGVAYLRAAMRREQGLDVVLEPSLAEMREANRALRLEVLSMLDRLVGVIEDTTADVERCR